MSSNRSTKTEWSINMLGLLLRLWGWNQDGRMWASDQQLVGRREISPEVRCSLKSVGPSALMGFIPSGDVGRA